MSDDEIRALAIEQGDETDNGFMFNKEGPWTLFKFARAVERAAYKAAIEACRDESVDAVATGSNEDRAYNTAIEHCADAISALIPKEPK